MNERTNTERNLAPTSELAASLIARLYHNDEHFAQRLREDPGQVVNDLFPKGCKVADNISIRTVDNTKDVVHVVLPGYPRLEEAARQIMHELTDEDIAGISGGEILITFLVGVGVTIAAGATAGAAVMGTSAVAAGAITAATVLTVAGVGAGVVGGAVAGGTVAGLNAAMPGA